MIFHIFVGKKPANFFPLNTKYFITLFAIIIAGVNLCSQAQTKTTITDLRKQFNKSTEDTTRINLLFDIGYEYINGPSDSLLLYFGKAINIIDSNLEKLLKEDNPNLEMIKKYQYFKVRALIEFGIEYFFRSDYSKAITYYFAALEVAKLHGDVELISECNSEIGIVYKNQGEYDLALEYYNRAYEMAQKTTDTSWIASCEINIGNVYKVKGYLIIAQKYYMDALAIMEKLGHERRIAACYQNIGDIYNEQRDYNLALEYYSRSLALAIKTNDKVRETTCYVNIGYAYINMNQNQVARSYLEKAIDLYNETGYQHELDICYILLGDTWLSEGFYNKAIDYYYLALEFLNEKKIKPVLLKLKGNWEQLTSIKKKIKRPFSIF